MLHTINNRSPVKSLIVGLLAALPSFACGPISKRSAAFEDVFANDQAATEYSSSYEGYSLQRLRAEYFTEMFIFRGINSDEPSGVSGGTARVTKNLLFWFDVDQSNDAIEAARELIPAALDILTNQKISAEIVFSKTQPSGTDSIPVQVSFDAEAKGGGHATFTENAAGEVTEASIGLLSSFQVLEDLTELQSFRYVLRHELGHILAATYHSGMSANIMSYNRTLTSSTNYQEYEIEAFQLLYDLEPGAKLDDLMAAGVIEPQHIDVAPRVVAVSDMTDRTLADNIVKAGSTISLRGERFNFKWGCSDLEFNFPSLAIGTTPLTVESYNTRTQGINGFNCIILNAKVPEGTPSGQLVLTTEYGKSSEGIFVTVK